MDKPYRFKTILTKRGKRLEYLLSVPKAFEIGGTYPALVALPPGEQTRDLVLAYEPWLHHFREQGWVRVEDSLRKAR